MTLLTLFNSAAPGAYVLTGDAGAFVISGQDATLLKTRILSADAGSFAISGQDATLTYVPNSAAYTLTADAGAFIISGQDATLDFVGDQLIGRKYPRHHRTRPRKQNVEVVEALKEVREEKDYAEEVLAEAQTELQLTKLTAYHSVNHNRNIDRISRKVTELETNVARLREEEEMLLMLTFVAMEM